MINKNGFIIYNVEKTCARCSKNVPETAKYCRHCGSSQFLSAKKCQFCDAQLPVKATNFCPTCGKRITDTKTSRQRPIIAPDGKIHNCGICRLEVKYDLVFCPSCVHAFHFNHLSAWILERKECPICKTLLIFAEE